MSHGILPISADETRAALAALVFHGPSQAFGGAPAYRFTGAHYVRSIEAAGFVVRLVSGNSSIDWTYHACKERL